MGFHRRRRLLVDRLQYRLLAVNVYYAGVFVLVFTFLLFGPLVWDLLLPDLDPNAMDQASAAFLILHYRVWPPLIAALLCLTIHSLIVSHRIAGPLYQFRHLFTRLKEGDLTVRARLRRHDYLTTEAQLINEMSASLERSLFEAQQDGADLCDALDGLKRELEAERQTAAVTTRLEILDSRILRFRQSMAGFKTGSERITGTERTTPEALPGSASVPGEVSAGTR